MSIVLILALIANFEGAINLFFNPSAYIAQNITFSRQYTYASTWWPNKHFLSSRLTLNIAYAPIVHLIEYNIIRKETQEPPDDHLYYCS